MTNELKLLSYEDALSVSKNEVDRALSASPIIIRKYTKHLTKSTGKFIRASALLICAQNKDSLIDPAATKLAAAIEILHLATLVHDDVIDDADLRRGRETLQNKFGKRTAVICGDYLLTLSLGMISDLKDKHEKYEDIDLPAYMSKICLGELNQHINNGNFNLTIKNYLKIISGKTAALFELAFFSGAVTADEAPSTLNKYRKIGRYIGMIFQLTDDCMDYESDVETALKPVLSDYEHNVITLPLIHALSRLEGLKARVEKSNLSKEEVHRAVIDSGGLRYTRALAKNYYSKSLDLIESLDIEKNKKDDLISILDKSYRVFN